MNRLHEVLEVCLRDMEQGADIETILFRYPDLADELRPILEASADAKSMAVSAPSPEVVLRNRTRVLQQAARMRAARAKSARRTWYVSLRRLAVTLAVVVTLFVSGTGLVRAASTTLPGDNLYPVKRTWEDVLVLFTFNLQQRQALEVEQENERLTELQELFIKRRSVRVDFAGLVTRQNGNDWTVASIPVVVSDQTEISDQQIGLGSPVRVVGQTESTGAVLAEQIDLLPLGTQLPQVTPEPEKENAPEQQMEGNSGSDSEKEMPTLQETKVPYATSESKDSGSKDSGNGDNHQSTEDSGGSQSSSDGSGGDH